MSDSTQNQGVEHDKLDVMREKANELLNRDDIESFSLAFQSDGEIGVICGYEGDEPYPNMLMEIWGLADYVSYITEMDPELSHEEPTGVLQMADHFANSHAEITETNTHRVNKDE